MGRLRMRGLTHLSPSGGSVLQACERQYVGRYGDEKIYDPPTEATAIGSGFAWALETGSVEAGVREYHANRPAGDPVFDDPDMRYRMARIAEAIITHGHAAYVRRFEDAADIEREVTYLCRLPLPPFPPSIGYEDALANAQERREAQAALSPRLLQVRVDGVGPGYLVEDKMRAGSSLQQGPLENEVRQGRQLTAEIWAHLETTGDHLSVSFRNCRKPDPRPLKKCEVDEIDDLVRAHFNNERNVVEYTVTRTEAQLQQWLDEQRELHVRADRLLAGDLTPVRNTSACHAYGRTCPLLATCQGLTHVGGAEVAAPFDLTINE